MLGMWFCVYSAGVPIRFGCWRRAKWEKAVSVENGFLGSTRTFIRGRVWKRERESKSSLTNCWTHTSWDFILIPNGLPQDTQYDPPEIRRKYVRKILLFSTHLPNSNSYKVSRKITLWINFLYSKSLNYSLDTKLNILIKLTDRLHNLGSFIHLK